jgi:probable rRNA maturation factor
MLTLIFSNQTDAPFTKDDFMPLIRKTEELVPKITETEVEFSLVDDPTIQEINKNTRNLDKPTDVLSFANREIEDPDLKDSESLGQIVISVPAAQRNADEIKQSLGEEVQFLFLHGLLHILGYDHETKPDETEMMTLAYKILGRDPYQPD